MEIPLSTLPAHVRADVCRALHIAADDASLVVLSVVGDDDQPHCVLAETWNFQKYLDGPARRYILPFIGTMREARTHVALLANDGQSFYVLPESEVRQKLFDMEAVRPSLHYIETGELLDLRLKEGVLPITQDGRFGKRPQRLPGAERSAALK